MLAEPRLFSLILYVSDLAAARAFYEDGLGLSPLEEDAASVKYSAGHVILHLRLAADAGVELKEGRDRSIDITFLVDDLDATRAVLESRGLRVSRTLDYAVGKTADLYDPDGHWFSIYEPSELSLTWPSGEKIVALRASSARNGNGSGTADLGGRDLVYLFVFVQDPESTQSFYHEVLGLEAIEGGPCKRGVTRLPVGVVKYDAGGTLLTTHAVDGEHAAEHGVTTEGSGGVALVFHATDIGASMADLSRGGVEFPDGRTESELGTVARFHDPSGHLYYLCEPSAEALAGPALERILAARV